MTQGTVPNCSGNEWLVSDDGLETLKLWRQRIAEYPDSFKLDAAIRKELPFDRAVAISGQLALNEKVKRKFPDLPFLLVTDKGLQQATDSLIAQYKRDAALKELPSESVRFADLCCGIGGDLIAFAKAVPSVGVDIDPTTALFAQTNCRLAGTDAKVFCCSAEEFDLSDYNLVHIDPDRRPSGRRTTNADFFQPPREFIDQLVSRVGQVIVKSAPGASIPELWRQNAQWEWIEHNGECKQAVGWFGFKSRLGDTIRATIVSETGVESFSAPAPKRSGVLSYQSQKTIQPSDCKYIYAPAPSLSTSGLISAFCQHFGLSELSPGGYLGSNELFVSPFVTAFEIEEVFPLNAKKVKQGLKQRGVDRIIIKKRGAVPEPEEFLKRLGFPNSASPDALTLLLFDKYAILGIRQ
ncbi:MAG: hypothetical protein IJQ39_03490 [Thermoguttaceae bacterium]|nr:hypothetical protein [Thermoguttaceae bacterium]